MAEGNQLTNGQTTERYCSGCGIPLSWDATMCPSCGSPQSRPYSQPYGQPYGQSYGNYPPRYGPSRPMVGFSGENSKRFTMATIFAILAFILLLASFWTSWYLWTISIEAEEGGVYVELDMDVEMSLEEMTLRLEGSGDGEQISESQSQDWDDINTGEVKEVYENTRAIMTGAVILGLLTMIFIIAAGVAGGRNLVLKRLPIILGILTVLVTLVAAGYFMASHPNAWEDEVEGEGSTDNPLLEFMFDDGPHKSFSGEDSATIDIDGTPADVGSKWRPDVGWYLTFVSAVFFLVSIALHRNAVGEDELTESIAMKRYAEAGPGPDPYRDAGPAPAYSQGYAPQYQDPYRTATYGEPRRAPAAEPAMDVFDIGTPQVVDHTCGTCGKETRYIEQYDRWWCDGCYKYI